MLTELVELPGGSFRMGSTSFYPEEAPIHTVTVAPFAIERHPVTNAQFAEFVEDTGYITVAERPLDPALYPGVAPGDLLPGALVFRATAGPVNLEGVLHVTSPDGIPRPGSKRGAPAAFIIALEGDEARSEVVADAVGSRTEQNRRLGLDRMRDAGARIVSREMVIFELMHQAGTEQFRTISRRFLVGKQP